MQDGLTLQKRHATRLRGRFRLETPLDPQGIERLANDLASIAGVKRAVVRPNTGSVIIEAAVPIDGIIAAIEDQGIAHIQEAPAPPPVGQLMQMGVLRADMEVRQQTGGAFDLRSAMATLLIMAALVQLTRGRLAGPATTLLMSALPLLDFQKLFDSRR